MLWWRRAVAMLMISTPLLALVVYSVGGVILGSLGMDIHWTSRSAAYIAGFALIVSLIACVAFGVTLLRQRQP